MSLCDGACVDEQSDPSHCGSCSHTCGVSAPVCSGGACECPSESLSCGVTCCLAPPSTTKCSGNVCRALVEPGLGVLRIAADETNVYWTATYVEDVTKGVVLKRPLLGGATTTLATSAVSPWAIAVDASYVYWVDLGIKSGGEAIPASLRRVPIPGGESRTLSTYPVVTGNEVAAYIALDAASAYWAIGGDSAVYGSAGVLDLLKVPLAGGATQTLATAASSGGLALDASYVYWAAGDAILRIPVAGGTPTTLVPSGGTALAVDATRLYWTQGSGSAQTPKGKILSVPIGGGKITTLVSGPGSPLDLLVDSESLYWLDRDSEVTGSIWKKSLAGGAPRKIVGPADLAFASLAINSTSLFWGAGAGVEQETPK